MRIIPVSDISLESDKMKIKLVEKYNFLKNAGNKFPTVENIIIYPKLSGRKSSNNFKNFLKKSKELKNLYEVNL